MEQNTDEQQICKLYFRRALDLLYPQSTQLISQG